MTTQFNLSQKAAKFIIENIIVRLWGFTSSLMLEIIRREGGLGSLLFVVKNMIRFELLMAKWGPIKTHILCVNISILNGCPYCIFGHAYAFNLHYFKDYKKLFPLDSFQIMEFAQFTKTQKIEKMEEILQDPKLEHLQESVDLQLALINGKEPSNKNERQIKFVQTLYDYLNACGIAAGSQPDEAHDTINKNVDLKNRYHEAREQTIIDMTE